jgi:ABC-2 type transport system permease protein
MKTMTDLPLPVARRIETINWVGLMTLIHREVARFMAVWIQTLVGPMTTLLLYFMVFAVAMDGQSSHVPGASYLHFLAPGLVMMTMMQNAFANTSSSLVIAKVQGSIVDILMPPLSSFELLVGLMVGGIIRGLMVGLAGTITVMMFVGLPLPNLFMLFGFALLGCSLLSVMGIIAGLWSQKFDHIAAVTNFIITPMTFLSGTFYAITQLPPFWQKLAHFNPFHHMIDGYRAAYTGVMETDMTLAMITLIISNIALFMLAWWMLYTGYRTRQ